MLSITGVIMVVASGLLYALMIMTSRGLKDNYTGTDLHLLILFGLIPTAIGGILYFNGMRLVKAQSASIINLLEPVSAMVFASIILSEPIEYTTGLGGGLILPGTLITSRDHISNQG